jgi:hypothetical protein
MEVSRPGLNISEFHHHLQVHVGLYTQGTIVCTTHRNAKFSLQYQRCWQLCSFPRLWRERGLLGSGGKAPIARVRRLC